MSLLLPDDDFLLPFLEALVDADLTDLLVDPLPLLAPEALLDPFFIADLVFADLTEASFDAPFLLDLDAPFLLDIIFGEEEADPLPLERRNGLAQARLDEGVENRCKNIQTILKI